MTQVYSDPSRAEDTYALPDVEVFFAKAGDLGEGQAEDENEPWQSEPGWYYWFCFPGCMPDSDPEGPFATEDEAIADAQADAKTED